MATNLVADSTVANQIDAAFADGNLEAVKAGLLGSAPIVRAVASALAKHGARNVVVDPVIASSSGRILLDDAGLELLRAQLIPNATIVTPNTVEAARLLGVTVPKTLDE